MTRRRSGRLYLALAAAFSLGACDVGGLLGDAVSRPVMDVTRTLDGAISELSRNSGQWQVTLQQLEADLTAQGQKTLANEVQSLIARGTAAVSLNTMCTADFLPSQLKEALEGLLAKARGQPSPPPKPHFCSIDPPSIDLDEAPSERPTTLNVYGFNLTASNVKVAVVDAAGRRKTPGRGFFNVPTEYMATFNIRNYPFERTHRFLQFALPDGEDRTVGINQGVACGEIDQPCCATGRACKNGAGCLTGRCQACPPPYVPPQATTQLYHPVYEKFDGNNCGGVNNVHRFGGRCHPGFVRSKCVAAIKETNSRHTSCEEVGGTGWVSSDPGDCRCAVRFKSDANCFHGIRCTVEIFEQEVVPPPPARPAGCP